MLALAPASRSSVQKKSAAAVATPNHARKRCMVVRAQNPLEDIKGGIKSAVNNVVDTVKRSNIVPIPNLSRKKEPSEKQDVMWFRFPPKIYFKGGCLEVALKELATKRRAFIVTDKTLYDIGIVDKVTHILDSIHVNHQVYYQVESDPTLANVKSGLHEMNQFKPDVIIAVGGGSPIDAAKAMWMMYEHPDMNLDFESGTFAEHRTHAYDLPNMGTLAELVCVPTTSGTGSEVTPFSVISDPASGKKFPLADYGLTPSMSIIDPQLVMSMPKKITSTSGFDALSHALESLVSAYATDFSKPFSKEAACLLLKYLPRAYKQGEVDVEAREKVHYAASIAGLAFANAFLGVGNAVAHKLCFTLRIPQGMADAAIISHVVAYNSKDPVACHEYAEVAHHLGLPGRTDQEKVTELIKLIEQIKTDCGIPNTIEQILGASRESDFMGHVDVMASEAMADPSTDANPRPVDVEDVKRMLRDAWKNPVKV